MGVARGHGKGGVAVVEKTFFCVAYKKTGNEKCRPVDWVAGMFVNKMGVAGGVGEGGLKSM